MSSSSLMAPSHFLMMFFFNLEYNFSLYAPVSHSLPSPQKHLTATVMRWLWFGYKEANHRNGRSALPPVPVEPKSTRVTCRLQQDQGKSTARRFHLSIWMLLFSFSLKAVIFKAVCGVFSPQERKYVQLGIYSLSAVSKGHLTRGNVASHFGVIHRLARQT